MKKITISFIALVFAFLTNAQVYLNETFAGTFTSLGVETSDPASEWFLQLSTSTNSPSRDASTPSLTYTDAFNEKEYILSDEGRTIYNYYPGQSSSGYVHSRPFSSSGISSGKIYYSFLYQSTAQSGNNAQVTGFGTSSTNYGNSIWSRAQGSGKYILGITQNSTSTGDVTWGTTSLDDNQIYLIVLERDADNHTATIYVNPVIGSISASESPYASQTNTASSAVSQLFFRGNGNNKIFFKISGIRVTGSWAEAVAAKLVAPVVGNANNFTFTGFTANWTPVDNATAYEVNVYEGESLVKTETVSGQSTSSTEITELVSNKTYVYTVTAISNGTYSNSDPVSSEASANSAEFTLMTTNTQPVDVDNLTIKVLTNEVGQIVIVSTNNNASQQTASIFNLQGQRVVEKRLNNGKTTIDRVFAAGVYLVKAGHRTVKIAVK